MNLDTASEKQYTIYIATANGQFTVSRSDKSDTEHQYVFDKDLIKIHTVGLFLSWRRDKIHSTRLLIQKQIVCFVGKRISPKLGIYVIWEKYGVASNYWLLPGEDLNFYFTVIIEEGKHPFIWESSLKSRWHFLEAGSVSWRVAFLRLSVILYSSMKELLWAQLGKNPSSQLLTSENTDTTTIHLQYCPELWAWSYTWAFE